MTVALPPGQEEQKTFEQTSTVDYQDAYRLIAKQMRACYRTIGPFGNGYDVQADLDTQAGQGTVEVYYVTPTGTTKESNALFSRTVYVSKSESGSRIKTVGTTPKYVYINHRAITSWLAGQSGCTGDIR